MTVGLKYSGLWKQMALVKKRYTGELGCFKNALEYMDLYTRRNEILSIFKEEFDHDKFVNLSYQQV